MNAQPKATNRIVLVTGPSGAGRWTAIKVLEDFGYETIDNIPLSLIPRMIDTDTSANRPLAIGIDARNRDFSVDGLLQLHQLLKQRPQTEATLLYLDCDLGVLVRRYSETRRRHPLAPDETPVDGIGREIALLGDVRSAADVLVDTSHLTVHDLKSELSSWFDVTRAQNLAVSVQSFSYKRGLPQGLDMAFDCRFLINPHWEPDLRPLTGLDQEVQTYVAQDERFAEFLQKVRDLVLFVLPACAQEGKAHFSVGFGCTGGKHRSVTLAEKVSAGLAQDGWQVSIRHRELERRGNANLAARIDEQLGRVSE
ncbi:MAG: RNase adapter RapZ [Pelagimonas sp.]|jgi:UPF0042 nucleotide-binding protein|nr:RNase adapter RapZ [Pelagimonas sp.]